MFMDAIRFKISHAACLTHRFDRLNDMFFSLFPNRPAIDLDHLNRTDGSLIMKKSTSSKCVEQYIEPLPILR